MPGRERAWVLLFLPLLLSKIVYYVDGGDTCVPIHVWRSEDNHWELVLSLCHVS